MNIAFIPVRGGSKSIPRKNVKEILGKPLICHTVDAALLANSIDRIIVATDADYIVDVINSFYYDEDKVEIYLRDAENATDTASTESVMLEYALKNNFSNIVLLQATSPLTTAEDIDGAFEKFQYSNCNSLLSVVKQKRFIWGFNSKEEFDSLNYNHEKRPRRQDFEGYFVENGAIYIISKENLIKSGNRLIQPIEFWEMHEDTFFEIDEPSDFIIVEELIKKRGNNNIVINPKNGLDIRLFLTDVDGVLTDAGMYYTESGDEIKKFNTRDGKGLELLREQGIKTGIVTSENTKLVERRAKKLKLDYLYQGIHNKLEVVKEIAAREGLTLEQIAYIGDDLNDLEVIKAVGLSACPFNAVSGIKKYAKIILNSNGGEGAVREFSEIIINK